jgi:two-component system sensor histidine kinase BarA
MPKMNGLDAASSIHQSSVLNTNTPIVLISASSNTFNNKELLPIGIKYWLQKPIDEKELLTHLLELLQHSPTNAINWAMCLQKSSGKKDRAQAFLDSFVDELKKNRFEFIQLMKSGDINGMENAAHKLHGACCYSGVPDLQKKVVQMEQLAKYAKNTDELEEAFADLIQNIDAVLDEYLLCQGI